MYSLFRSMSFDKCIESHIPQSRYKTSPSPPNFLLLPLCGPPTPNPWYHWSVLQPVSFIFSRNSYKWNHTVGSLLSLAFSTECLTLVCVLCVSTVHSLCLLLSTFHYMNVLLCLPFFHVSLTAALWAVMSLLDSKELGIRDVSSRAKFWSNSKFRVLSHHTQGWFGPLTQSAFLYSLSRRVPDSLSSWRIPLLECRAWED